MREIQDLRPVPQPDEIPGGPSGLLTLAAFPPAGYEPPKVDPKVASNLSKLQSIFSEVEPVDNPIGYISEYPFLVEPDVTYEKDSSGHRNKVVHKINYLTPSQLDTVKSIKLPYKGDNSKDAYLSDGKIPYKNQFLHGVMIDNDSKIVSGPLSFGYDKMLYSRLISSAMPYRLAHQNENGSVNAYDCHNAFIHKLNEISDYKGDISKGYMEINMPLMRLMALLLTLRLAMNENFDFYEKEPIENSFPDGINDFLEGIVNNFAKYKDISEATTPYLYIIKYINEHAKELSQYAIPLTTIKDGELKGLSVTPQNSILAMAVAICMYYCGWDNDYGSPFDEYQKYPNSDIMLMVCGGFVKTNYGLMSMYKPASVRTPEFIQAVDKLAKDHPEVWQPALTEDGNAIKRSNAGFILSKYLPSNFERPFKKYYKNHEGLHKEFEPFDGFYDSLETFLDGDDVSGNTGYDCDDLFNQLDWFFGELLDKYTDDDFRIPIHIYGISDTYGPTGYDADNTTMSVTKQPDGTYVKNPIVPATMKVK